MYFEYIYLLITGLYQLFLCVQLIGFFIRVNKDIIIIIIIVVIVIIVVIIIIIIIFIFINFLAFSSV